MSRSRLSLRNLALTALTLGSLGFGVSQAVASPTPITNEPLCGLLYSCTVWCQQTTNNPNAQGWCNRLQCVCFIPQ